jgi:hypothetical protein
MRCNFMYRLNILVLKIHPYNNCNKEGLSIPTRMKKSYAMFFFSELFLKRSKTDLISAQLSSASLSFFFFIKCRKFESLLLVWT